MTQRMIYSNRTSLVKFYDAQWREMGGFGGFGRYSDTPLQPLTPNGRDSSGLQRPH